MTNPLLADGALPEFSSIQPEHVVPAVEARINEARAVVAKLVDQAETPTYQNFVFVIEEAMDALEKTFSPVGHLNGVADSEALRVPYREAVSLITAFQTEFNQNPAIYQAYKKVLEHEMDLSSAQKKALADAVQGFELAGVALPEVERKRFGDIQGELAQLQQQFQEHVLDATKAFSMHITDESELAGLSEDDKALLAQYAQAKQLDGWLINLEIPCYLAIMERASNRSLRQAVHEAWVSRASEVGPNAGEFDNRPVMEKIMQLRQEAAELLGFKAYDEYALQTRMAESPEQVFNFLTELAHKSKAQAQADVAELAEFAKADLALDTLEAWDMAYASQKLQEKKYSISNELIKPYFPLPTVISGLFRTLEQLFNVSVEEVTSFDTYHPDVRFYQITRNSEVIAQFYFDLFAREGKRGGAWMDVCRSRRLTSDGVQIPVAYMVCNFSPATGNKPSLLTHSDVETLFHEFGHGIHHMLTQVDVSAVSGIAGVPWDAVELPSQFMENYCWQPEVLAYLSSHYETNEPLPQTLLDKMLAAKNFQSAMQMLRQLEFALYDFTLHHKFRKGQEQLITDVMQDVRQEVSVVPVAALNRFANGFSHIFAGGYAAGYYSYKWAEVLSADAFSRFEEEGIFAAQAAADFAHYILGQGGSQPMAELYRQFRGREATVDALLRHSGIAA
ncbi:M3 family metallopeptidase [Salinibius halmophilus]|uniref:M3 family metallopeptidase n=1 Tax=Salinibius halmophilus TaxID=1853216 RepID=UPI000E6691E5|nr:M3 family metallopeptidase [Salinibius halmophilus]